MGKHTRRGGASGRKEGRKKDEKSLFLKAHFYIHRDKRGKGNPAEEA